MKDIDLHSTNNHRLIHTIALVLAVATTNAACGPCAKTNTNGTESTNKDSKDPIDNSQPQCPANPNVAFQQNSSWNKAKVLFQNCLYPTGLPPSMPAQHRVITCRNTASQMVFSGIQDKTEREQLAHCFQQLPPPSPPPPQ